MTEHDTDDGDSIEVKAVNEIEAPGDLPDDWLAVAMEPMPEDHIQTIEDRLGWDNINDLEDLKKILYVLDDDQLEGR